MYISVKLCQGLSLKWDLYFKTLFTSILRLFFNENNYWKDPKYSTQSNVPHGKFNVFDCSESLGMTDAVTCDSQ